MINPFFKRNLFSTFFISLIFTQEAFGLPPPCEEKLNYIITSALTQPGYKEEEILTEIESENNGIYLIRLSTPASSNEYPKTDLSMGWIRLDTRIMKAFDPTIDDENPVELKINPELLATFTKECLSHYFVIEEFTAPLAPEKASPLSSMESHEK
jgi:hypothetical protein